ncbi:MAG: prephenate dehydrogenase/arogenate dehydrogenase family protein [archaeon]
MKKINIIGGSGIMGQIHKKIFEEAGYEVIISGRNSVPSIEDAAKNSDLTIVSVPISATEEVIKKAAPNCKAIMDFTGLKIFPVKTMLKYSDENCEVAGLHPMYGNVDSIKGRSIIYCKTEKTGKKCEEVVKCLKQAGAKIKEMTPERHDLIVSALSQNIRSEILEAYSLLMEDYGISAEDLYEIASPLTKIILDAIARQVNPKNDEMYREMRKFNPFEEEIKDRFLKNLEKVNEKDIPEKVRKLFGDKLGEAQERAKKYTNEN